MLTKLKLPKLLKRPAHTLLFITEVKTFRIDTDSKGILLSEVEVIGHGCRAIGQLPKAFAKIAEQSPAPLGKKVWLLVLRLPALLVSLPTLQIKGVDEATLMQALQFEAEGMTGQSSQEMRAAHYFLKTENDMSDYWLVQIEQLLWEDLLKAVKKSKTQLAGLLHPGLLPRFLGHQAADEWLRMEAWSMQLLAICRTDAHTDVLAVSFEQPQWRAELEHWLLAHEAQVDTETLLNNRLEVLPATAGGYRLNNPDDIAYWLGQWAAVLTAKDPSKEAALLTASSTINPDLLWMGGSGLVVLGLCLAHAGWFIQQRSHYEAETQRLTRVEKTINDLNKKISDAETQKHSLEDKLDKLAGDAASIPALIKNLRQRPALLLRALADGRDPQLIIETFASNGQQVVIEGVALQPQLASQLVNYLALNLRGLNWQLEPPTVKDMDLLGMDPGPWAVTLKLTDTGAPSLRPDTPEATKK